MGLRTVIMLVVLSIFFVGIVKADLVFRENFEADQLDENAWGFAGPGVGGPDGGTISDMQAYGDTRSWWIGSNNGIYHIVDPPLKTCTVYVHFYDNADEAQVNAQVVGCTNETAEVNGWPIGAGSWMYIGICTTGPNCMGYYYRSATDGEICVGDERETGWHLFAFVIDGGKLKVYVDGENMEDCDMPELGNFVIFHAWAADQFQREGGFIDDIYIFSDIMDPAEDPSLAVQPERKLAVTWGSIK